MKTYPVYNYTSLEASGRSGRSMLKEYASMRKEGMRRLKSLKSGDYMKYSEQIRALTRGGFPTVAELRGDPDRIRKQLSRMSQFLANPLSTRTGMKKVIKSDVEFFGKYLEDPEFLTKERLPIFYDFLEEFRSAATSQLYPSKFVFQLWEMSERVGISKLSLLEDVSYWEEHRNDWELLEPNKNHRRMSSKQAKRKLEKAIREKAQKLEITAGIRKPKKRR